MPIEEKEKEVEKPPQEIEPKIEKEEKKVEEAETPETPPKKVEEELSPVELFKKEFQGGNRDNARKILESMNDEDISSLVNENEEILKLVLDFAEEKGRYDLAINFATKLAEMNPSDENLLRKSRTLIELGRVDEAEKELNELLKRNMKNGFALYEKAKIMAVKGNEMGVRNFLMMATKFAPELKSRLMSEKYFEAYKDKDWFKKFAS